MGHAQCPTHSRHLTNASYCSQNFQAFVKFPKVSTVIMDYLHLSGGEIYTNSSMWPVPGTKWPLEKLGSPAPPPTWHAPFLSDVL